MVGGVDAHICRWVGSVGTALPTTTLIKLNDAVALGVEIAAERRARARSWSAMDNQRGLAAGIAGGRPVDEVAIPHIEQSLVVRLDFWVAHERQSVSRRMWGGSGASIRP